MIILFVAKIYSCSDSKMKARKILQFVFVIAVVASTTSQSSVYYPNCGEIIELNEKQSVNITTLHNKLLDYVATLENLIGNLQKNISVYPIPKNMEKLEKQLQLLQNNISSTAEELELKKEIGLRHDDLINSTETALNETLADRFSVGYSLAGKDINNHVTGKLRQNETEIKNFSRDPIVDLSTKRTALHIAVLNGKREQVIYLLRNGANIEAQDFKKWRPLHFGTWQDDIKIIQELLSRGAKVNSIDEFGYTPLHWAVQFSKPEYATLLLHKGANIDATDINGETPLYKAFHAQKQIEMVQFLVKQGANVNALKNDRSTPLHATAQYGYLDIIKLLVEKGANVRAKDKYGNTAAGLADSRKHQDVVNYLKLHT